MRLPAPAGTTLVRSAVKISVVVGNPKPRSRTYEIAHELARHLAAVTGADQLHSVDLAEHAADLFTWPHDGLAELNAQVAASDYLVVASPTYKATYTGLLKAFFDRYPNNALAGVTAVPVMTASAPEHAMAVEVFLRPLLVELGASVPARGLAFCMTQMGEMHEIVAAWAAANLAGRRLA